VRHLCTPGPPSRLGALEVNDHRRRGEVLPGLHQPLGLPGQLAGQPAVVVVQERDQVGCAGLDAGVTRTGQAGGAVVGDHPDRDGRVDGRQGRFSVVEDDGDPQVARVLLGGRGLDGTGEQLRTVAPGRDDDLDGRGAQNVAHQARLPAGCVDSR
jgi:hypothetical protein